MSEEQHQEKPYPLQPYPQQPYTQQPYPQELYPQQLQPQQETSLQSGGAAKFTEATGHNEPPPDYNAMQLEMQPAAYYPNQPVTGRAQAYVQPPPMAGPQPIMMGGPGGVPQAGVSNVTMVGTAQPTATTIIVNQQRPYDACGHIAFSCAVIWCCNLPFGVVAFALALAAQSAGGNNNQKDAQCLGRASLWVNISGIILTVIVIVVVIVLFVVVGVGVVNEANDYSYP